VSGAGHTPGPWRVEDETELGGFAVYAEYNGQFGRKTAIICSRNRWEHQAAASLANARLIAAAPDLLSALRDLAVVVSGYPMSGMDAEARLQAAYAAIARAEGREP